MRSGSFLADWHRLVPGPRATVGCASALVAAVALLSALGPWLDARDPAPGVSVRAIFAPVCHQIPGRSLASAAGPHALCARCEGLYAGAALGLALAALAQFRRRVTKGWLLLALTPVFLDVVARAAGAPGLDSWPRFLASTPAGVAAGMLLATGLADGSLFLVRRGSPRGAHRAASRAGRLAEISHG